MPTAEPCLADAIEEQVGYWRAAGVQPLTVVDALIGHQHPYLVQDWNVVRRLLTKRCSEGVSDE